jgi:glycosyltransferase family protein
MLSELLHKIFKVVRQRIPLSFRKWLGPYVAYFVYIWRIYVIKNKNAPKILGLIETLDVIKNNELSVIRFGDGEMSLIEDEALNFQQKNSELAIKLRSIVQIDKPGLLICIPGIWGKLHGFTTVSYWFILHHLFRYSHAWKKILVIDKIYGDAYITRPYLVFKDKSQTEIIFKKLFSIWNKKEVILIEGEKSRLGVGNDMFNNVNSLRRILCPAENAYDKYSEIKTEALKLPKNTLILLSLGPTAKVLAYELFIEGFRVIDIGHIDMEYEMFLRNSPTLVKVPYKYFNEINERNPEECTDDLYQSQIIKRIL